MMKEAIIWQKAESRNIYRWIQEYCKYFYVSLFQGSMCDDCMVIGCCGPCAACQEARELNNMGIP